MTTTLPEHQLLRDEVRQVVHSFKSDYLVVHFLSGDHMTVKKEKFPYEEGDYVLRHIINGVTILMEKI
jgi:hypothetical protein